MRARRQAAWRRKKDAENTASAASSTLAVYSAPAVTEPPLLSPAHSPGRRRRDKAYLSPARSPGKRRRDKQQSASPEPTPQPVAAATQPLSAIITLLSCLCPGINSHSHPFVFKSQNGCASTIQVAPPTSSTRAPSRCRWTPRRQERSYTSQSHV